MSETKTPLYKYLNHEGENVYSIGPEHSISDVLRHLASEVNGNWKHIIQLCEDLKTDSLKLKF